MIPVAIGIVLVEISKKPLSEIFSKMKIRDNVTVTLKDKYGKKKKLFKRFWTYRLLGCEVAFLTGMFVYALPLHNLTTNAGLGAAPDLLGDVNSIAAFEYLELGTGSTAANVTDTALETPTVATGLARAIGATSLSTTTVTNDTLEVVKNFTNSSGGTVNITEYGLLNASSSGVLLARVVQASVGVNDTDVLGVTWKIKAS